MAKDRDGGERIIRTGPYPELTWTALIVGYMLGVPIGVYSAVKRGGFFDNVSRVFAVLLSAVPSFWLSLQIILVFAVKFSEWDLPAIPSGRMYSLTPAEEMGFGQKLAVAWIQKTPLVRVPVFP